MSACHQGQGQGWTPEPTYQKPDISVRATTLYYEIMARLMLPFMGGRLLNLFRCRQEECFFQRSRAHPPSGRGFKEPVRFERVEQKNGRTEDYLYVNDSEGIVACAKVQTVEFHGWGSRAGQTETPDRLVIDLDPGEGVGFGQVTEAALQLRRSFEAIGLDCFPLLTGGKGVHVVVPIAPETMWAEVRHFAKAFCTALAEADPAASPSRCPSRSAGALSSSTICGIRGRRRRSSPIRRGRGMALPLLRRSAGPSCRRSSARMLSPSWMQRS